MSRGFRVAFELSDDDLVYFRKLQCDVQRRSQERRPGAIIAAARKLISRVREEPKRPRFVVDAIDDLAELIEMLEDQDYALPAETRTRALGALVYFADPQDLIPDRIPGLGFLDDALMIRLTKDDLKHELRGYGKFKRLREGAEVRPWTALARARRPRRMAEYRRRVRAEIEVRRREDTERSRHSIAW